MKKEIIAIGTVVLSLLGMQFDAEAAVNRQVTVKGKASNFTNDWENTIYYCKKNEKPSLQNNVARMIYGYETFGWNEDYVWTQGYTGKTQASLTNCKGTYGAGMANAWKFSKEEVHHKDNSTDVTYRIWMEKEDGYFFYYYYGTSEK